jgi:hypothetical protein
MGKGKAVPIGVRDVLMGTLRFAHPTNEVAKYQV